jgi:outer membrane protein assembly factor BamB
MYCIFRKEKRRMRARKSMSIALIGILTTILITTANSLVVCVSTSNGIYDWPMIGYDLACTAFSPSSVLNTNETSWVADIPAAGAGWWPYPIVAEGTVFLGLGGNLTAWHEDDGVLLWNCEAPAGFGSPSNLAAADGMVFAVTYEGNVYASNVTTGAHIWSLTGSYGLSPPIIAEGRLYVGGGQYPIATTGIVGCLNATTGALIWRYSPTQDLVNSIAVAYGKVYVGCGHWETPTEGAIYCLDMYDGSYIWSFNTHTDYTGSIAVANGKVYFTASYEGWNSIVYALDATNGAIVWSTTRYYNGDAGRAAVAYGKVFVCFGYSGRGVYALDETNGNEIWAFPIIPEQPVPGHMSNPIWVVVADGKVFFGPSYPSHMFYAVSESTGAVIWSYRLPGAVEGRSGAVANGRVFVADYWDLKLYAFGYAGPDTQPPMTKIHLEGTLGTSGWYVSDVGVQLSAVDRSGVAKIEYSFDDIAWTEYAGDFVISTVGTITLYYRSTDNVGNIEQTKVQAIKIDKSAPTGVITSPQHKDYPQDEDLPINFNVADMISGVYSAKAIITPDPATIYIDPQITEVQPGESFSINISIANAIDVYVWQIKLDWNPTILSFVSAAEGGFLSSHGQTIYATDTTEIDQGHLGLGATILGPVGVNGDGILATVTFQAIAGGDSPLIFSSIGEYTWILDSNLNEIPFGVVNGAVSVQMGPPVHDVAVTSVTASPTIVEAGETVTINIVVENQGTKAETFDVSAFYDSNLFSAQTLVLAAHASTALTFTWDTTGVTKGSYLIKAAASIVPEEIDTVDNTYIDGPVTVGMTVQDGQTIDLSTLPVGKYTLTVTAIDNAGNKAETSITFNVIIHANIDVNPDTLNLKSKGNWITAYIELPKGYSVADINVSAVMLNGTVPAELSPTAVGDYDSDGIPDLMVKFDRAAVQQYILDNLPIEAKFMTTTLTITGRLNDGTPFQGSDTIKIVFPIDYWKSFCLEKLEKA